MDLKRLKYFLHVADYGSFSRASSVIGIAQPALGRQIQKLEETHGVKLLYRHGRGVSLTPEGQAFSERIRPLLAELTMAIDDLNASKQVVAGSVTLGLTPTVMSLLGLPLLQRIRALHPDIKLNFLTGYSGYVHEWLVDGRLDLAILHDARRSQHIAVDPLANARLFLVSHPEQAELIGARHPMGISMESVQHLPLALPSTSHGLRRTLEQAASSLKIELNVEYELDTLTLMKDVALSGIAHTILAVPAVVNEVNTGRLTATALTSPEIETRLMIATSLNRPLTRAGRTVLAQIRPVMQKAIDSSPLPLYMRMQ